jgi:hypothetical protein
MVPTENGQITMDGVMGDILALQGNNASILPANSGIHQFAPGMVLEIPIPKRKKRRGKRKTSKVKAKPIKKSKLATKTVKRFNDRNKRTMDYNRKGNVGLPFGKKIYT